MESKGFDHFGRLSKAAAVMRNLPFDLCDQFKIPHGGIGCITKWHIIADSVRVETSRKDDNRIFLGCS